MSVNTLDTSDAAPSAHPRLVPGAAGLALIAALALAMVPGRPAALVVVLALVGAVIAAIQGVPSVWRLIRRRRTLLLVVVLAILAALWLATGITRAGGHWPGVYGAPNDAPYPFPGWPIALFNPPAGFPPVDGWPWRVGQLSLSLLLLTILCAACGLVLVADAVRVQLGFARPPRSGWRSLTATPTETGRTAARAIPGVALIGVATFLGISLASRFVGDDPVLATLAILGIGGSAALLIASPLAIGLSMRLDFDKAGRAREEERRRFAAHLHDSVLQTLALIQRQAHDPASVARLARRQEHALRAWMAGETELTSDTLAAAVRDVVAEVEDDHGITVELTAIGDHGLEARGEALVAAAREALRNAARHAPGAPVYVFLDVNAERAELFVRDNGPGFDPEAVPAERRGLRDAVIGRMQVAGGDASVESAAGEGTEVALRLPYNGRSK